jgi:tRNA 2-thiouridine synthesizing protein A
VELVVDTRGLLCPLPVIELARRITDVAVGDTVAVLSDDPAAAADIPAWCRMRGHEYAGAREEPDITGSGVTGSGATSYVVRRLH